MWYHWDKLRHYLNDLRVQCANSLHCKNIVLYIVFTVGINFITLTSFTAYTTYRILHTMQVLGGSKSFSCEFIDTKFNIFPPFLILEVKTTFRLVKFIFVKSGKVPTPPPQKKKNLTGPGGDFVRRYIKHNFSSFI